MNIVNVRKFISDFSMWYCTKNKKRKKINQKFSCKTEKNIWFIDFKKKKM